MNFPPMINGRLYGWSDISFAPMGIPIAGILAINYKDSQVIDAVMAGGNRANGVGFGNVSTNGSITLLKEEVDAMVNSAPGGRIQNIPAFPVIVSFMPEGSTNISINTLKWVIMKENAVDTKQGDTSIGVTIELFVGDIKWK